MSDLISTGGVGAMIGGVTLWLAAAIIPRITRAPLRRAAAVHVTGEVAFWLGVLLVGAAKLR